MSDTKSQNQPRVMIVDDDPGARMLARAALEQKEIRVVEAADGQKALRLFGEVGPDLVLLDIVMPEMDGFSVCKALRKLPNGQDTPVLVVTALDDVSSISRAYEAGATDFIGKPVNHVILQQRVRYMLRATETMRELRQSEQRLARAHQTAGLAHWEWDVVGDTMWASETFSVFFGGKPPVQEGIDGCLKLVNPQDSIRVVGAFEDAIRKKYSLSIEHGVVLPDGSSRFIQHTAEPAFDESGSAIKWIGTIQDVTERTELRRQLMHADRLTVVGQLAAGVAHEINNPASFVLSNLVLMDEHLGVLQEVVTQMRCKNQAAEERGAEIEQTNTESLFIDHRLARRIQEIKEMIADNLGGMQRIVGIVKDLASFSRIERDEVETFDINQVVRAACNITANQIRHSGRLVLELEECPKLSGHPGKIGQVVTNLLINASHAIRNPRPSGHQVLVTTRAEGNVVKLQVKDTGCGVPESNQQYIFDPFFTTKPRDKGTGLGLSLSAEFVRKHGGDIRLAETSDQGSLFEITLPMRDVRRSSIPNEMVPPSSEQTRNHRILVIDDEIPLLRAFKRMMNRNSAVITACGGREALSILEKDFEFDAVICDLMMPDVDGIEVYEWLRANNIELANRLIFCTGGAFTQRVKDFTSLSNVPLVPKPIDWENLTALIDSLANTLPNA